MEWWNGILFYIPCIRESLFDSYGEQKDYPASKLFSVLGPLLFLIYINDINETAKNERFFFLFTDDTNIFLVSDNTNNLKQDAQHTLLELSKWFATNKLLHNNDKSCYTVFGSPTKLQSIPASLACLNSLCFGNQVINRVHHAKYLGLILDESLSWNEHIESLIKQLSKILISYKVVRHHVEKDN